MFNKEFLSIESFKHKTFSKVKGKFRRVNRSRRGCLSRSKEGQFSKTWRAFSCALQPCLQLGERQWSIIIMNVTFWIKKYIGKNCNIACDVRQSSLEGDRVDVFRRVAAVGHLDFSILLARSYLRIKEENIRLFIDFYLNLVSIEIQKTASRYFLS